MKNYYDQKQIIAEVNKKGEILSMIDKWEAHKNGVLHKGISITLIYKNKYILQHRRHPAFNGVFDLSYSTHQVYHQDNLESAETASIIALKREWNLNKSDIVNKPKSLGFIYYKDKDPKSIYTEHEICEMLTLKIKRLPTPNFDFSYGYSLASKEELNNKKSRIYENLSPWSKVAIKERLI